MSEPSSPKATPKRKRDDLFIEEKLAGTPISKAIKNSVFTFEPPRPENSTEDGSNSPRTKVANKFRDLSLERSGGGVQTTPTPEGIDSQQPVIEERLGRSSKTAVFDFSGGSPGQDGTDNMQLDDDDNGVRKRHKHVQLNGETFPGVNGESSAEAAGPVKIDEQGKLALETAVDPNLIRVVRYGSTGDLQKSYPSINRLADSKSRGRRRSGTPPMSASRYKSTGAIEEPPMIIDPVRAALTWHEDEITVYDSEDKDDDGTGLNGIGFRPTPAIAYQRAQKRKKQLAEYKKREESEARARRNQRRREALGGGSELKRQHSVIRVHFSEAEPDTLVMR